MVNLIGKAKFLYPFVQRMKTVCERGARQELGVVIANNTDKVGVLSVIQTRRTYLVVQRTRVAKLCQCTSDRT